MYQFQVGEGLEVKLYEARLTKQIALTTIKNLGLFGRVVLESPNPSPGAAVNLFHGGSKFRGSNVDQQSRGKYKVEMSIRVRNLQGRGLQKFCRGQPRLRF